MWKNILLSEGYRSIKTSWTLRFGNSVDCIVAVHRSSISFVNLLSGAQIRNSEKKLLWELGRRSTWSVSCCSFFSRQGDVTMIVEPNIVQMTSHSLESATVLHSHQIIQIRRVQYQDLKYEYARDLHPKRTFTYRWPFSSNIFPERRHWFIHQPFQDLSTWAGN